MKKIFLIILILMCSLTQISGSNPAFNLASIRPPSTPTALSHNPTSRPYTIFLKNAEPARVRDAIKNLFCDVPISIDERSRALMVNTTASTYQSIEEVVSKLDKALPQIKIEVQIIELNYSNFDQYKNIFSNLTDGFKINYNFTENRMTASDIEGTLGYLIKSGQAKVLAKPTISTVDNNRSSIKVGDRVPYVTTTWTQNTQNTQVNYLDTGIDLEILPQIASGNAVFTEINTSISSIKLWKDYKEVSLPVIASRKTQTRVLIENNKTLVIAGLLDEQQHNNHETVPFLSDLYLIGPLFKGQSQEKSQTDIVFLITPQIF